MQTKVRRTCFMNLLSSWQMGEKVRKLSRGARLAFAGLAVKRGPVHLWRVVLSPGAFDLA
jgi:hypothetical protein